MNDFLIKNDKSYFSYLVSLGEERGFIRVPEEEQKYEVGRNRLSEELHGLRNLLKPKVKETGSSWTENNFYLSRQNSSMPGKIKLFGYQKGILDAMTDPDVSQVSVLKGARVGYTMIAKAITAYYIAHDPSPILFIQPTAKDAEKFSKSDISPMLRDIEALSKVVRPIKRGDSQDTVTEMQFKNGSTLVLDGAARDDAFRRIGTRVNIGDEIDGDGWRGDNKGSQGDKLKLLRTRGLTFWNSKFIVGSTPLWKHSSKITREYEASDQRRYFVPCPHCKSSQYLKFGGKDVDYGLKWDVDEDGEIVNVRYICEVNHCEIYEKDKAWMDEKGEWLPTAKPKKAGHAGFHLWTGMSLFPNAGWKFIAEEFMESCKKPELLQPFVNLVLGEPYEDRKEVKPQIDVDSKLEDLEVYDAEVPSDAVLLTVGVDVQTGSENESKKNARLEASVWAWGGGEEAWLIEHAIIEGAMDHPQTQAKLDEFLLRRYKKADGTELIAQAVAIDMGGHYTQAVKDFARGRMKRNVWAVKGKNIRKGTRTASVWPRAASKKNADQFFMIDTQLAKDAIGRRLSIEEDGPGKVHFPAGTSKEYLKGITSERLVRVREGGTYWKKENEQAYGEPLDCFVYAYACLQGLKMTSKRWRNLDAIAKIITENKTATLKASNETQHEEEASNKPSTKQELPPDIHKQEQEQDKSHIIRKPKPQENIDPNKDSERKNVRRGRKIRSRGTFMGKR